MAIEHKTRKTVKKHDKKNNQLVESANNIQSEKKPIVIGLVYWKECFHCKALKPAWEETKMNVAADNQLNSMVEFVEMEKDDHDAETKLAEINSGLVECKPIVINGYPTMFCKKENYVKSYSGGRSADELTSWVRNVTLHGQMGGKKKRTAKKVPTKKHTNSKKSLVSFLKFW